MNKLIKSLVEHYSLIKEDNIFQKHKDVFLKHSDNDNVVLKSKGQEMSIINNITQIATQLINKKDLRYEESCDNCVYIQKISNCAFFYIKDKSDNIRFLSYMDFNMKSCQMDEQTFVNTVQDFFNWLLSYDIKYIASKIYIKLSDNIEKIKKDYNVDFNNILAISYEISNINPINLNINDQLLFDNIKLAGGYIDNYQWNYYNSSDWKKNISYHIHHEFKNCDVTKLKVTNIRKISFNNCICDNFDNINNIETEFKFYASNIERLPASHSFQGLPDGNYGVYLSFEYLQCPTEYTGQKLLSLKGIPETVEKIYISFYQVNPYTFLKFFSFEGLTIPMIKKLDFNFRSRYYFGGRKHPNGQIQLGPYLIPTSFINWKPTQTQLKGIISTNDWFLDAYLTSKGPHIEYTPPVNASSENMDRVKREIQKAKDKIEDKIEDEKLVFERFQKIFYKGMELAQSKSGDWKYKLNELQQSQYSQNLLIQYSYKGYNGNVYQRSETLKEFLKTLLSDESWENAEHYRYKNKNGVWCNNFLKYLYGPIERRRKNIINQRKEEERKQRQERKEQNKKQNNEQNKKETTQQTAAIQSQDDVLQELKTKLNIEIVDYSEYALAIFGNTFQIRDKLKEIQARFNPRLNYGNTKKAGWVVPKSKKDKLIDILSK